MYQVCTDNWRYLYINEILDRIDPVIKTFEIGLAEEVAASAAAGIVVAVVVAAVAAASVVVFAVAASSAAGADVHHTQDHHPAALAHQALRFASAAVGAVSDLAQALVGSLAVEGHRIQGLDLLDQEGSCVENPGCLDIPLADAHLDLADLGQELSWNAAVEDAVVVAVAAAVVHARTRN